MRFIRVIYLSFLKFIFFSRESKSTLLPKCWRKSKESSWNFMLKKSRMYWAEFESVKSYSRSSCVHLFSYSLKIFILTHNEDVLRFRTRKKNCKKKKRLICFQPYHFDDLNTCKQIVILTWITPSLLSHKPEGPVYFKTEVFENFSRKT